MKKLLSFILITCLLIALGGCGGENDVKNVSISAVDMGLDNVNNGIRDIIQVSAESPVVTLDDEEVAKVINDDIKQVSADFLLRLQQMFSGANEYSADMADMGIDNALFAMDLQVRDACVNGDVLSIVLEEYNVTGGAHGSSLRYALNYDLNDGKRLTWEDISTDSTALSKTLKDYIVTQASSSKYEDYYFFDYYEDSLDSAFGDDTWYFNNQGLTIIYNQYAIAPYAAGIIEFTMPLEDIEQLNLNAEHIRHTKKGTFVEIFSDDGQEQDDIRLDVGEKNFSDSQSFLLKAGDDIDCLKIYAVNGYEDLNNDSETGGTLYADKLLALVTDLQKGEFIRVNQELAEDIPNMVVSIESAEGVENYLLLKNKADDSISAENIDNTSWQFSQ